MKIRDKTIDHLRGFAMFWVIVVHVLYWGRFFSNEYVNLIKSFCLFEMPLFFFVTGAGNSCSKVEGYFKFVYKRYKRILVPYWVFALICASLSVAYLSIGNKVDLVTIIKIFISWLIPVDRQITTVSYLTWALWFVPVYLCVILIIPLLKRMKQSKKAIVFMIVLFALFVISCFINIGWIQKITFYSIWTYAGLFYSDIISRLEKRSFRRHLLVLALIGAGAMFVLCLLGQSIDMQYNKFPPNIMFGAFSVTMMALVILMIPNINRLHDFIGKNRLANKVAELFSSRSMTIFLYQVFAFNITIRLTNKLIPGTSIMDTIAKPIFCLVTTVLLCVFLALVFGGVEKLGMVRSKKIQKAQS